MKTSVITTRRKLKKARVRQRVVGTKARPRLSVFISNTHIMAQLIDDTAGKTLVSVTTIGQKKLPKTMTEKAQWVGEQIATKAKAGKTKTIVFDRGWRIYHGRVKALAEAARTNGLEF